MMAGWYEILGLTDSLASLIPSGPEQWYNDGMDHQDFEAVVMEAISALPKHIREALKDIVIVIEDRPSRAQGGTLLLGLYQGVPLTRWGRDFSGKLPDKIILFMEPIEEAADSSEDIPRVIRETVWHEIGHYFGLDHTHIKRMEKRWRSRS